MAQRKEFKLRLIHRLSSLFQMEFTRRIHEGTPGTFESVYQTFRHPIRTWMNRKLESPELTEELTQEVFLRAWKSRRLFHPAYELSQWLRAIARNLLIDRFRGGIEASLALEDPHLLIEKTACPGLNPERELERRHRDQEVARRLQELTPEQQEVLHLRLVEQMSYHEIAARLNISLSTVKNQIHRAKLRLLQPH
jgi:RNA polymerase sigma-70 factor (ECF subfamily)